MKERLSHPGSIGEILFEISPVGVFTFDRTGQVTRCNPTMVRLLGSPDEKTTHLFNVLTLPTVPERIREDIVRRCLEDGKARDAEFLYVSMHGKQSYLRFHFLPVLDQSGVVEGVIAQAIDMSSVRHVAEGLRRSSKMESLSLMAGALSHDLNNIFTTLLGFTSILSRPLELTADRTAKAVSHTRKAAESGAKLVQQLLNFTSERRADASACPFAHALSQTTTLFSYGLPPQIKVMSHRKVPDSLWVRGSATKIEQVLLNILLNARDALEMQQGTISIHATTADEAPADALLCPPHSEMGFVRVAIEDSGSGMTPEVLQRIFEPYFTTKGPERGTGLGLPSVWGILQEVGGGLQVHSSAGSGSTFELYFPVTAPGRESTADQTPQLLSLAGNGERILVVEPDQQLSEMLVWLLLKNGYKALAATGAPHAAELLDSLGESIAAIIWDLSVGGKGLEDVVSRTSGMNLAIIQLTNTGRIAATRQDLPTVAKPFPPSQLLETLATALSARRAPMDAPAK